MSVDQHASDLATTEEVADGFRPVTLEEVDPITIGADVEETGATSTGAGAGAGADRQLEGKKKKKGIKFVGNEMPEFDRLGPSDFRRMLPIVMSTAGAAGPEEGEEGEEGGAAGPEAAKFPPHYYTVSTQTCPQSRLYLRIQLDLKKGNLGVGVEACGYLPIDSTGPPNTVHYTTLPLVMKIDDANQLSPNIVSFNLRLDCEWCMEFWASFLIEVDLRTFVVAGITPSNSRFPYCATNFDAAHPKPRNMQRLFSSPDNMVCEPAPQHDVERELSRAREQGVNLVEKEKKESPPNAIIRAAREKVERLWRTTCFRAKGATADLQASLNDALDCAKAAGAMGVIKEIVDGQMKLISAGGVPPEAAEIAATTAALTANNALKLAENVVASVTQGGKRGRRSHSTEEGEGGEQGSTKTMRRADRGGGGGGGLGTGHSGGGGEEMECGLLF